MKSNGKKGFTIVELVIVIAVIAILAAVLIPTFSNIIKKAKTSADIQLVKNLNTVLALAQATDGKNGTMYDAIADCYDGGYVIENLTPTYDKNDIVWDNLNDRFLLIGEDSTVIYMDADEAEYSSEVTDDLKPVVGGVLKPEIAYRYFKVYNNWDEYKAEEAKGYSIYANSDFAKKPAKDPGFKDGIINVSVGFDAGSNTVVLDSDGNETTQAIFAGINYTGENPVNACVFRTSTFLSTLYINNPKADVKHYGFANVVYVESVSPTSFHEYGIVGRLQAKEGHFVAEDNCEVFCLMDERSVKTDPIVVKDKAIVHIEQEHIRDAQGKENNVTKNIEGVASSFVRYCKDGEHHWENLVIDQEHAYKVCRVCGYILYDGNGKLFAYTPESEIASAGLTTSSVVNESRIAKVNENKNVGNNTEENGIVALNRTAEQKEEAKHPHNNGTTTCQHNWTHIANGENCIALCTKCGIAYTQNHDYFNETSSKFFAKCPVCDVTLGTEELPWHISNATELVAVNKSVSEFYKTRKTYYKLTNDIIAEPSDAKIVGDIYCLIVNGLNLDFNGNSKKITIKCDDENEKYVLLFYQTQNALIHDLDVEINDQNLILNGYNGTILDNVDVYGYLNVGNNTGAYMTYAYNSCEFRNCDNYATILGEGAPGYYNAIYIGYSFDHVQTFTNCHNYGSIVCGKATMFVGNVNNKYKANIVINNCSNNGLIQWCDVDSSKGTSGQYNQILAGSAQCVGKVTIDGVEYTKLSDILNISVPTAGNGAFIWGPTDTSLAICENTDKTFTINAAANTSASYYIVRISTYGHCEDGGSRQFSVSQRIEATEFNDGQFITALLKGNFVDKEWVENHPEAVKGTLAGNDIYTLDGVVYYLMNYDDSSFGGHVGGISAISVSAYNADDKPIATASLAK